MSLTTVPDLSASESWLEAHLTEVPTRLVGAVRSLVGPWIADGDSGMAAAALHGFETVAHDTGARDKALVLLAADALLTYAFEAAADPALGGSAAAAVELAGQIGPCGSLGSRLEAGP